MINGRRVSHMPTVKALTLVAVFVFGNFILQVTSAENDDFSVSPYLARSLLETPEKKDKNLDLGEFSESMARLHEDIKAWQKLAESLQEQTIVLEEQLALNNEYFAKVVLENKEREDEREKERESNETQESSSTKKIMDVKNISSLSVSIATDVKRVMDLKERMLVTANTVNSLMEQGVQIKGKKWRGLEPCPHLTRGPSRILQWKPNPNRYLVALCVTGHMSHRIRCLQLYVGLAALLNRILIYPNFDLAPKVSSPRRLNFHAAINDEHLKMCVGKDKILTPKEFLHKTRSSSLDIKVYCLSSGTWGSKHCSDWRFFDTWENEIPLAIKIIGVEQQPRVEGGESLAQFLSAYINLNDSIISFGEVQYFNFSGIPDLLVNPNGPVHVEPKCSLLLQSRGAILSTVDEIARVFLGTHFIGIHVHRGDISRNCLPNDVNCEQPMRDLASCLASRLNNLNTTFSTIYVSSTVHRWEWELFTKLVLEKTNKPYAILGLDDLVDKEWSRILRAKNWDKDEDVIYEVEKTLLSTNSVFFASGASAFAMDVMRRRLASRTATCLDKPMCEEEWDLDAEYILRMGKL